LHFFSVWLVFIVEDPTVTVETRKAIPLKLALNTNQAINQIAIKALFLFFHLCLSEMLVSLSCPLTSISFHTNFFWVSRCDVHYNLRINTMFGSSLTPIVCRGLMSYLCYLCLLAHRYYVVFLLCFSWSCVPYVVSFSALSFLTAPSVFSNVYLNKLKCVYCKLDKMRQCYHGYSWNILVNKHVGKTDQCMMMTI